MSAAGIAAAAPQVGDVPTRPMDGLAVAVIVVECLPLIVRRRWPVVCMALVSVAFVVDQFRGYHTVAGSALPVALLSAGAHLEHRRRATAVVASVAYVPLAAALGRYGHSAGVIEFGVFYLGLVLAWGIGSWLRLSRETEAQRRRHVAATTRAAERTRIARELHDVVTHHVTAMVVQTEATRYLTAAPELLDGALSAVADSGRRALDDLRQLLDALDPDDADPRAPSVGELPDLVARTRRSGQPVEFTEEGRPAGTPEGAGAAIYRVVQEALTNALKYAPGARTTVQLRYRDGETVATVSTNGSDTPAVSFGGSGRGLAGLRARVEALGGEFSSGAGAGGDFVVRARIPAC